MNPYHALGLQPNADIAEVKKKYKELAKQLHPDKPGGDAEKFKVIQQAYDHICNGRGSSQRPPNDIHAQFFHMFHTHVFRPKCVKEIRLSVEDAYHGKTIGIGVNGENVQFRIKPGTKDCEECVINMKNVDLIIRLKVMDNSKYSISGDDIHTRVSVHIYQLLTQLEIEYTHIDNRVYLIKVPRGVCTPGSHVVVKGLGMPIKNESIFGNLCLFFDVTMPDVVYDKDWDALKALLQYTESSSGKIRSVIHGDIHLKK